MTDERNRPDPGGRGAYLERMYKGLRNFLKATELCVTYGFVLGTPAKEIKKMKLRQIEKELKTLEGEQ